MPILSAGMGVMSAVGGAQSEQQQANAQYAANKAQRQQIINNQRSKLTLDTAKYNNKKGDRQAADIEVGRAGNEAYLGNQRKYNEKIAAFMTNKQGRLIKSMEAAGTLGARGQSGGSIDAQLNAVDAATGRDTATALAGLRSSATSLMADNRAIQGKMAGDYRANFDQIGDLPTQGFTPPEAVKPAGPNPLSIAASIGGSVLSGVSSIQAMNTLPGGQTLDMMGGGNAPSGAFTPGGTAQFTNYDSGLNLW
jgi:hypothetical protein